jgi:hypothetical protein
MIGLANPTVVQGSTHPKISMTKKGYRFIHSGLLADVEIASSTVARVKGEQLFRMSLNPASLEQWLARMANFEKYRFKNIAISWKPTVAVTQPGAIVGWFEWDVDDPLVLDQGEETLRDALAHESASLVSVYRPHTWVFSNKEEPEEEWYVDQGTRELRFTDQGMFTLCAASDFAAETDVSGQLVVAYEVEFMIPELRSTQQGTYGVYEGGANQTYDYPFGDSITHAGVNWDSPFSGLLKVPQNALMKYHVVGGDSLFQLPRGYWLVVFHVQGTGLGYSGNDVTVTGGYDVLCDDTGLANWGEVAGSNGQFEAYYLIYSNGWNLNWNDNLNLPDDGFSADSVLNAGDPISSAYIFVAYLNGVPPATLPGNVGLAKLLKRVRELEERVGDRSITKEESPKEKEKLTDIEDLPGPACKCTIHGTNAKAPNAGTVIESNGNVRVTGI